MKLLFDPHVHFYKVFSIEKFLTSAYQNFERYETDADGYALCLTEKNDCNFFNFLRNESKINGFKVTQNTNSIALTRDDKLPLIVFPGRQINSREGIEVLALFRNEPLAEKMPLGELIAGINSKCEIPVINWAPGKWMGRRGLIIEEFLQNYNLPIALGYTSLLPKYFPLPELISKYNKKIPVFLGSDPFPFKNQETLIGRCSLKVNVPVLLDCELELDKPEFVKLLLNFDFKIFGERSNFGEVAIRLLRNEIDRRL